MARFNDFCSGGGSSNNNNLFFKFFIFALWSVGAGFSLTLPGDPVESNWISTVLTPEASPSIATAASATPSSEAPDPPLTIVPLNPILNTHDDINASPPIHRQVEAGDQAVRERRAEFTFSGPSYHHTASTKSNHHCTCIHYYSCPEQEVVPEAAWQCQSKLDVCCRRPHVTPTPPYGIITGPPVYTHHPPTSSPEFKPQCGTRNPNGINARVLSPKDSETHFGEYPWMAAILESQQQHGHQSQRGKNTLVFVCGAALIWPSVAVTAAHCIKGKQANQLRVRLGEWDTQSDKEFYPHQDLQVQEFIIHPEYYQGSLFNDLALLFFTRPATLAPHVDTICLPPQSTQDVDPEKCIATGWGKDAFGETGAFQVILKEVDLPLVPSFQCQDLLRRRSDLGSHFQLHPSFLCAGGHSGRDTCVGDGGGPLVCPSRRNPWLYELTGVVSWGFKCGLAHVPGVYVNVTGFRNWIDHTLRQRVPDYDPTKAEVPPSYG